MSSAKGPAARKASKRKASAASAQGTLRVAKAPGKEQGCAVVVDVGQCSIRCRKLFEDEDGAEEAAWFATSTGAVRAFREFVFAEHGSGKLGHSRASGGQSSSNSGAARLRSFVCIRQNRWTGVRYSVVMARLANGQLRAISFHDRKNSRVQHKDGSSKNDEELIKRAIGFLRSVAFKSWREQDPTGQETRAGLSERGLKHPSAFVGYEKGEKVDCSCGRNRSKGLMVSCGTCGVREHMECLEYKQMPADHTCSACLRAQKEEVIVISMDEQEESRLLSTTGGGSWTESKARRERGDGSVCCHCGCEDNEDFETMIQSSCTCEGEAVLAHSSCLALAVECGAPKDRSKQGTAPCLTCGRLGSSKEAKPPTLKRTATRRFNSEHSGRTIKRLRSALVNTGKAEAANDTPPEPEAKKPEASLSASRFSDALSAVPIKKRRIQMMDTIRSPSPPRSRSPSPIQNSTKDSGKQDEAKPEGGKEVYEERLPRCTENKIGGEEDAASDDFEADFGSFKRQKVDESLEDSDPSEQNLAGDNNSHRDRSHWDLNMDMEAWARPFSCGENSQQMPEDDSLTSIQTAEECLGEDKEDELTGAVAGEDPAGVLKERKEPDAMKVLDVNAKSELDAGPILKADPVPDTAAKGDAEAKRDLQADLDAVVKADASTGVEEEDAVPEVTPVGGQAEVAAQSALAITSSVMAEQVDLAVAETENPAKSASQQTDFKDEYDAFEEDEPDSDPAGKNISQEAEKVEEGQIRDWVEDAGEDVDYGDSDEDVPDVEGAEQGEINEPGAASHSPRGEAAGDRRSEAREQKEGQERENPDHSHKSASTRRAKSSGWDQLPDGFETAEDALRASKEYMRHSGGRPMAWGRGGRPFAGASRQFDGFDRFDSPWARQEHYDQRNGLYDPVFHREFDPARGRGAMVGRRGEGMWMNGCAGPQGQWTGPKPSPPSRFTDFGPHGQANAAAVAAAKVESSGFIVAPDGTVTKAGGSPGAARPFPPPRNPATMMLNPNDPRAPPTGMRVVGSPGMRGVMPPAAAAPPPSRAGQHHRHYGTETPPPRAIRSGWDRREPEMTPFIYRSSNTSNSSSRRRSRSKSRSRSRSRSLSPRRYGNRSPLHRTGGREGSPAGRTSVPPPPKLPLPPPPPRGQRSPPAGLKRLGYHHRDVEVTTRSSAEDRRKFESGIRRDSSRPTSAGFRSSRDAGEDEVAPRRRRPPS